MGSAIAKNDPSHIDKAEKHIFEGIKIAQGSELKPFLAMGQLCLGELYADNTKKEKAHENLKNAESMYQEMGMGLWLGITREIMDR